jgi:hypothetical protein
MKEIIDSIRAKVDSLALVNNEGEFIRASILEDLDKFFIPVAPEQPVETFTTNSTESVIVTPPDSEGSPEGERRPSKKKK